MENQIVMELINYLKTVPDDREISTRESVVALLGDDNYDDTYLFDLDQEVRKAAQQYGLQLDSSHYEGMAVGLPFNTGYYVIKK